MSILLAGTAVLAQLCYQAENDLGSHEFLKQAQTFHAPLTALIEKRESGCLDIINEKDHEEAKRLVSTDASQNTLKIKS